MKKILAWVLALTMVAAGSVGATLAYLVNTDEDVNVMTLGKVLIDQLEYERTDAEAEGEDADIQKFRHDKPLFPGVYDEAFDFPIRRVLSIGIPSVRTAIPLRSGTRRR